MASNSLDYLSYKDSPAPVPKSTDHREDIIHGYLHELKIAYKVMAGHPDVLKEFVCAVKAGCSPPE